MSKQVEAGYRNLPYFVYGTLRPGHRNFDALLKGRIVGEPAKGTVRGFIMVSLGGFPMAIHTGNESDVIVGNLVNIRPKEFVEVTKSLDRLEGYPTFYDKLVVNALETMDASDSTTVSKMREAYIYASPEETQSSYLKLYEKIIGGDWEKRS